MYTSNEDDERSEGQRRVHQEAPDKQSGADQPPLQAANDQHYQEHLTVSNDDNNDYDSSNGEQEDIPIGEQVLLESDSPTGEDRNDLFVTSDEDDQNKSTTLNRSGKRQAHPFEPSDEHAPLVPSHSASDVRWASDAENEYYDPYHLDDSPEDSPEDLAAFDDYENDARAQRAAYVIGAGSFAVLSIVIVVVISGITALTTTSRTELFVLQSAWKDGGEIPREYGCYAGGLGPVSMPVHWKGVPPRTHSIVILLHNPGILQGVSRKDPVHWFVMNVRADFGDMPKDAFGGIPQNASYAGLLPHGAVERANSGYKNGQYWPPCPTNRTKFALYAFAVDAKPAIQDFDDAREIINRFGGIPQSKLTGYYGPPRGEALPHSSESRQV